MSWEDFKRHGVYKFILDKPHVAFRDQIENGAPFQTPSGKIEILCSELATIPTGRRPVRLSHPLDSEVDRAVGVVEQPQDQGLPVPSDLAAPALAHSLDLQQLRLVAGDLRAGGDGQRRADAKTFGIKTGDTVEIWNERGKVVVPVYVTERCMPGVLVLHEGAWMDLDENGIDRSGNPDILTLDEPSPAGAFCYNTVLVPDGQDRSGAPSRGGTTGHGAVARLPPRLVRPIWRDHG
jgi:anaerobic dimethyl sulfoxide reductase subunit A